MIHASWFSIGYDQIQVGDSDRVGVLNRNLFKNKDDINVGY
jgi:hypothetical protein